MSESLWSSTSSLSTKSNYIPNNEEAKLIASDPGSYDHFGYSVAMNATGDYVIIGARYDDISVTNQGSAYIFTRSGTTWTQQAKLRDISGASDSDYFGYSVAMNGTGDYVAIGSLGVDSPNINQGAVFIFIRSGTAWTQQAKLQGNEGISQDNFGYSVAITPDATRVIIGAPQVGAPSLMKGKIYIFVRSGTTWTQEYTTTPVLATNDARLGWSVAINSDGMYAIGGAPYDDPSSSTDAGVAYIYTRSGSTWSEQTRLIASNKATNNHFGNSVSINSTGDRVIVGAMDTPGIYTNQGAAYIYLRSGTTWTQEAILSSPTVSGADRFGSSVVINDNGNIVVIGSYLFDAVKVDRGCIFIFTRSGTTWTFQSRIMASDGDDYDYFSSSLGINASGTYIAIGAYQETHTISQQGSVYIYS